MLQPSQWSPSLLKDKINMTTKLANHSEKEKGKKNKKKGRKEKCKGFSKLNKQLLF